MEIAVFKRPTLTTLQGSFLFCVFTHSGRKVPLDPECQRWGKAAPGRGHLAHLRGICCCCFVLSLLSPVVPKLTQGTWP